MAIKCGEFEIVDLLLENGADADFMEDQSQKPENTSASYFMSMSVLHDAIIGTFITEANEVLRRYSHSSELNSDKKFKAVKNICLRC